MAQESLFSGVREVAKPGLPDVAVVMHDDQRPIIYYNPERLRRLGPDLSTFFRAHEYAHVHLDHRARELAIGPTVAMRKRLESEADCFAAMALRDRHPTAVHAAIRYFDEVQGNYAPDAFHASGRERARGLRSCLAAN